jgi:hypothetical protein
MTNPLPPRFPATHHLFVTLPKGSEPTCYLLNVADGSPNGRVVRWANDWQPWAHNLNDLSDEALEAWLQERWLGETGEVGKLKLERV